MTTLQQALSATEKYISKEAPIVKKETIGIIRKIYLWCVSNPVKTSAIIGFIVGFILGTLV
jgi:hypothetical protein